ncbi:MAG: triose-phosphate isomerase [Phycisphaerales bacterium]
MRKKIICGNWKMNLDRAGAVALASAVAKVGNKGMLVGVCPPFPYLMAVGEALNGSGVSLGAQDVYHAEKGAFTGEVSVGMLKDCGVKVVLAGHSERRHVIGEGDDLVNLKVRAALHGGMKVILCVGETLHQRKVDETNHVNEKQTRLGLRGVTEAEMASVIIAYEPVWAIGTGHPVTPDDGQTAAAHIRAVVADMFGKSVAGDLHILYGGGVSAETARGLIDTPDIDGALIGGASLKAGEFEAIVGEAERCTR